jgi:hypothetical protein
MRSNNEENFFQAKKWNRIQYKHEKGAKYDKKHAYLIAKQLCVICLSHAVLVEKARKKNAMNLKVVSHCNIEFKHLNNENLVYCWNNYIMR